MKESTVEDKDLQAGASAGDAQPVSYTHLNVVLGSHRLNLTLLRIIGNQRTRSSGVHRIAQTDGDIGILGRLDAGRVQNLGTDVYKRQIVSCGVFT